ncbi:hypothetical protein Xmau_01426 [Xenorhabdus mauleonii]|uniref:Glycosyltransferase sugar-binding region containing DXD motif-containing protein n=1 Tax=Xenorhabdus mauleonii TaxID=351675 RepID=A0A1I3PR88_9GAMM|nr:glycosyltransferase [Xenorhabdus mauleonii]PHM44714.1 hypothetical protein Xmau_01426 [Xenorhabdus mauleonii]SFJ23999.1 Glycosyltransferase sugar-binding region containing DXD motif-containing protein [Xenorhabdus mauleonii]
MNIPKKIHYFWAGDNIPENFMENIMKMKLANAGFEINLWSNNKSLFLSTFRSMTKNVGEIFGYEFDKVKRGSNSLYIRDMKDAFKLLDRESLKRAALTGEPPEIDFLLLKSLYYRNVNGCYHNYALASDIARLVILYVEGGIYLDVDVELKDSLSDLLKITRAKFKDTYAPLGIAFGDITVGKEPEGDLENRAWVNNNFGGNAIIAAPRKSDKILGILRFSQSKFNVNKDYYDINKKVTPSNKPRNINLHYSPNPISSANHIRLLNIADPSKPIPNNPINQNGWQESAYKKYPNGMKDTWSASRVIPDIRSDITTGNTGPYLYKEYLKGIDTDRLPTNMRPSAKFRIEKNDERLFRKVDAQKSSWSTVGKENIGHTDDTEFPSRSGWNRMYHKRIMEFLKKW